MQVTALGDSKHCLHRLFNEFTQIKPFYELKIMNIQILKNLLL